MVRGRAGSTVSVRARESIFIDAQRLAWTHLHGVFDARAQPLVRALDQQHEAILRVDAERLGAHLDAQPVRFAQIPIDDDLHAPPAPVLQLSFTTTLSQSTQRRRCSITHLECDALPSPEPLFRP